MAAKSAPMIGAPQKHTPISLCMYVCMYVWKQLWAQISRLRSAPVLSVLEHLCEDIVPVRPPIPYPDVLHAVGSVAHHLLYLTSTYIHAYIRSI